MHLALIPKGKAQRIRNHRAKWTKTVTYAFLQEDTGMIQLDRGSGVSWQESLLSEFRSRLIDGQAERLLFDTLLERLREHQLVKPGGRQRTDSTHVLAASTVLNRLECVGETLRHALNRLATVAPTWLRSWVPAVWFDRYGRRFEEYRLPPGKPERYALAEEIGADGRQVLLAVYAEAAPTWLREVEAVQILRGWRWSSSWPLPKASRIAKRLMACAAALTGSTLWPCP